MVTQRPLEALFMVRIHVGQPLFPNKSRQRQASHADICPEFEELARQQAAARRIIDRAYWGPEHSEMEKSLRNANLKFEKFARANLLKRAALAAVCHEDSTGRLHTVKQSQNALYDDLIKTFSQKSGTPVVLNTASMKTSRLWTRRSRRWIVSRARIWRCCASGRSSPPSRAR
jgi:hypothetical protein